MSCLSRGRSKSSSDNMVQCVVNENVLVLSSIVNGPWPKGSLVSRSNEGEKVNKLMNKSPSGAVQCSAIQSPYLHTAQL